MASLVTAVNNVVKLASVEIEVSGFLRVLGKVLGGIDLSRGVSIKADEGARRLRMTLPRASVLAVDPVVEWFDEKSG